MNIEEFGPVQDWYVGAMEILPPDVLKRLEFVKRSLRDGYTFYREDCRSDDPTFDNRWLDQWPFKEAA